MLLSAKEYKEKTELILSNKEPVELGYKFVDENVCFLRKSMVSVIAGRPAIGKTFAAITFTKNLIESNRTVLYGAFNFSAERLLYTLENEFFLNPIALQKNLYVREHSCTVETLDSEISSKGISPDVIVVDDFASMCDAYQSVEASSKQDVLEKLQILADKYNASVVLIAGVSRQVEARDNHMPGEADILDFELLSEKVYRMAAVYRKRYYAEFEEDIDDSLEVLFFNGLRGMEHLFLKWEQPQ